MVKTTLLVVNFENHLANEVPVLVADSCQHVSFTLLDVDFQQVDTCHALFVNDFR